MQVDIPLCYSKKETVSAATLISPLPVIKWGTVYFEDMGCRLAEEPDQQTALPAVVVRGTDGWQAA